MNKLCNVTVQDIQLLVFAIDRSCGEGEGHGRGMGETWEGMGRSLEGDGRGMGGNGRDMGGSREVQWRGE